MNSLNSGAMYAGGVVDVPSDDSAIGMDVTTGATSYAPWLC